jgi:hypothetical protein
MTMRSNNRMSSPAAAGRLFTCTTRVRQLEFWQIGGYIMVAMNRRVNAIVSLRSWKSLRIGSGYKQEQVCNQQCYSSVLIKQTPDQKTQLHIPGCVSQTPVQPPDNQRRMDISTLVIPIVPREPASYQHKCLPNSVNPRHAYISHKSCIATWKSIPLSSST